MKTVYIHGGTVIDPSQHLEGWADLLCRDGVIAGIFPDPAPKETAFHTSQADLVISAADGKLPLSETIAKVTSIPAARLGLSSKGSLRQVCDADLVIFDLNTVTAKATYTHPVLPPEGIDGVLIGGEAAVREGRLVREDLGRALRA